MKKEATVQVADLLRIDQEEIFWMQVEYADEFLHSWCKDETVVQLMKDTREFWGWWKQVWHNNDKMLLHLFGNAISEDCLHDMVQSGHALTYYRSWHQPRTLELRPNDVVIRAAMRNKVKSKSK